MGDMIKFFADKIDNIKENDEIFQIVADAVCTVNDDIYAVCLRVDPETFEILPVRNIDKVLKKNINDSLASGILGQILEPNKSVIVADSEKFKLNEGEYILLLPLFYQNVQYGVVAIVFPSSVFQVITDMKEDFDLLSKFASQSIGLRDKAFELERKSKEMEDTLERLNDIVQNVVHGLIALDNSNNIMIFNKNAELLFGVGAKAVIGKSYRESFPEKITRALDILVESTLIEGSILDYEIEVELAPTITIPVGISSSVLYDKLGQHQGIIMVCRDMSLTKEVNRLKELDKMKSEFVSMVSHELKNPIAIIKTSVETLQAAKRLGKSLGEDFENQTLQSIHDETTRLSQLINDILNLAKIESGKVEIKKEPMNIERLIMSATHLFKIHEETHPLNIEIRGEEKTVLLDPDKIKQVIINYVGNAIKYTPNGGQIDIVAEIADGKFNFYVKDKGIGIPKDKQNDVFKKFSRISTPETQSISGTGLGLSICKKIIELHGGHVWFESEYGKGSTFGFTLVISGIGNEEGE